MVDETRKEEQSVVAERKQLRSRRRTIEDLPSGFAASSTNETADSKRAFLVRSARDADVDENVAVHLFERADNKQRERMDGTHRREPRRKGGQR